MYELLIEYTYDEGVHFDCPPNHQMVLVWDGHSCYRTWIESFFFFLNKMVHYFLKNVSYKNHLNFI